MHEIFSQKICSLRTLKFRICYELKRKKKKKKVWEKELAPWAQLCPNQQKEACVGISIPTQEFLTLKPVYTGLHHSPICTSLEFSFPSTFMVLLDGWITLTAHTSLIVSMLFAWNNYRKVSSLRGSCVLWMLWSSFAFLFLLWEFHGLILQSFWGLLTPAELAGSGQHSLEVWWHPGQAGWVFNPVIHGDVRVFQARNTEFYGSGICLLILFALSYFGNRSFNVH